jgi:DNA-binding NarL/FixJ family response regulator
MALAAVVTDLIFATKILTEARAQGRVVSVLRSFSKMEEFLKATPPDFLIVDMHSGGIDGISAIGKAMTCAPPCKVLAYLSHGEQELALKARQAGASEVVPRSEFVLLLPELVKTYADPAGVSPKGI